MVGLIVLEARAAQAQLPAPQVFTGVGHAEVSAAIAAFKAAIGGADNGVSLGSAPGGFREVTWDDVPDALAAPNDFPFDFYNTMSPRGLIVGQSGIGGGPYLNPPVNPVLQVSASAGNPTSTPILYGNVNPALPPHFVAFSPQRIFRSHLTATGQSTPYANFAVPGSSAPATVKALGAVFTDVNLPGGTTIEFFDLNNLSLGAFEVPATTGHQTVSFLGVVFPGAHIIGIQLRLGTGWVSDTVMEDATHDVVAMDNVIFSEPQPIGPPVITVNTPTAQADFTATAPYLTLAGRVTNSHNMTWTNDRGGSGVISGPPSSATWAVSGIPVAAGANVITLTALPRFGTTPVTKVLHVDGGPFTYALAEGSTGSFFDTDITIANPNAVAAPVAIRFLREDGGHVVQTDSIAPTSRKTIHVDGLAGLEETAFSTVVVSESRLPLVVERTMFWDQGRYGGKGASAVDTPSETWLFAEGVQNGFFSTFILLENPGTEPATATVTFERAFGEPPVIHPMTLPALSRVTLDTGSLPDLLGRSFGVSIQATRPIVAERATYFGSTPTQLWPGGHGSPGAIGPSGLWFFAEGATGPPVGRRHDDVRHDDARRALGLCRGAGRRTAELSHVHSPLQSESPAERHGRRDRDVPQDRWQHRRPHVFRAAVHDRRSGLDAQAFITIDANTIPALAGQSFGTLIEVTNGVEITTERSMYWDANGIMWVGGAATAGTRLP